MYFNMSRRVARMAPGRSIFILTVAVAQIKDSSTECFCLSAMYAAKVVSPLPERPERFLALIGQR